MMFKTVNLAKTLYSYFIVSLFKFTRSTAFDYVEWSVSIAEDVNGDGFVDLVIGASGANPSSNPEGLWPGRALRQVLQPL
ncbi:MAG: integrin alpha [Candidatus Midichloria sp.]|nr:MAG: integrin alpha [Candidatus Midichloria sp.]